MMSDSLLPGLGGWSQLPDFSGGEDFLRQMRASLHQRQRRRVFTASVMATVTAVFLFMFSFSAIQRQIDQDLWQEYLLSEMEEVIDSPILDDFTWELYLESVLQAEDLDLLLEEILGLEGGEQWIQAVNVKG